MSWTRIPLVSGAELSSGHFEELKKDPLGLFRRAAAEGGQGLIRLAVGPSPFIIVNNPATIEMVLVDPQKIFFKPKMDLWRRLLGASLLTTNGDDWLRSRKRTQPIVGQRYVQRHTRIVTEITDDRVRSWSSTNLIDVLQEMKVITLTSSLRSLCSTNRSFNIPAFTAKLKQVMQYIQMRETSAPGAEVDEDGERHFLSAVAALRASVEQVIADHHKGTDDLIALLLAHPDFQNGRLTVAQVCDDVLAHLIAGYESTATALAWTLLLIAGSPQVESRLREEITRTVGSRHPEITDLNQMAFLHATFTEALRLYPPSWGILRASTKALELDGVRVPKGSCVVASQYTVHRDHHWFEQPDAFIPERWLEGKLAPIPRFAYFPFGGGRRACPGQRMAQATAYTIIARVLQQCHVGPGPSEAVPVMHVTLQPDTSAFIRVTPVGINGAARRCIVPNAW